MPHQKLVDILEGNKLSTEKASARVTGVHEEAGFPLQLVPLPSAVLGFTGNKLRPHYNC